MEKLIEAHFGNSYDIINGEECSNDSVKRFSINDGELSEYVLNKINDFRARNKVFHYYLLNALLRHMCNQKIIASGIYLIKIKW